MTSVVEEKILETLREVRTVNDQITLRDAIGVIEGGLYRKDGLETNRILADNLPERLYQVIRKVLAEKIFSDSEELKKYIAGIKDRLQKMKEIYFEIVFDPDEYFIGEISEWILKELGEDIVIDFYLNPSIVGGAVIISGGEYFDFTMSAILERTFEKSWADVNRERNI